MDFERYTPPQVIIKKSGIDIAIVNNEVELLRVQYIVAQENSDEYSVQFKDRNIKIDSNGQLEDWPNDMYSQAGIEIAKIFQLRKSRIQNAKS